MSTRIAVNRMHWPVEVLGPGRRIGIWVQGCTIGCAGCASRDTWPEAAASDRLSIPELVARIDALVDGHVDGATITGGEPLDQPGPTLALTAALRTWLLSRAPGGDILVYTGYTEAAARRRCPELFDTADAVIAGPYIEDAAGTAWWGSANQRLIVADEEVRVRYERALDESQPRVQIAVDDDTIHVVGIPAPGTLPMIERRLAEAGIHLEEVSWRP